MIRDILIERACAKFIHWRALSIRNPRDCMAAALARYWERKASEV